MTTAAADRTDERIQRDVLDELAWDAQAQPNEIGVSVDDGVVTLTGQVDAYARKWAAQRCAQRVRGVRAVADDVEVRLPGEPGRTDAEIAIAAGRALEWDSFVPAERLDVTVANGWVMLRGEVEFGWQRRTAERELRRLRGVRGVTNLVEVRPVTRPDTGRTRRDLQRALGRGIGTERVTVELDGDTVVLTGVVRSWWERDEAERVAWSAEGVRAVRDRLLVGG
ncbi:Osmotically-inducible protein OsmY, contains BON domain [Micromonospora echinofusca]|uniref:Osmotically-inducible protein OsmY, contains BON domain n=1 Tax=Micromonospora echinofusca TaxID=47858 RepID=A0A1C5G3H5_MICEH|nr:BON domain-containing protein [Micromonospora echinofusca]SCG14403.1 Osmotically-inducible protein OsmY, contains BON domain [Micromonospora echinofusca]